MTQAEGTITHRGKDYEVQLSDSKPLSLPDSEEFEVLAGEDRFSRVLDLSGVVQDRLHPGFGMETSAVVFQVGRRGRSTTINVMAYLIGEESIYDGMEDLIASAEGITYGEIDPGLPNMVIPVDRFFSQADLEAIKTRFCQEFGLNVDTQKLRLIPPDNKFSEEDSFEEYAIDWDDAEDECF